MLQGSFRAIFEHLDTDNSGQLDMGEAGSLPESLVYFLAIDGLNHPQSSPGAAMPEHHAALWTSLDANFENCFGSVGRCGQMWADVGSWV